MPKLGLALPKDVIVATDDIEDTGLKAMIKYYRHPSILAIKEKEKYLKLSFFSVSLYN